MEKITAERVNAGIRLYSLGFLFIYDWFALGLSCKYLWKCSRSHMLTMYDNHVSSNHLDIGVGTGYFMDKCSFPSPHPRLALMDLNTNSLKTAGKRLNRYNPEIYQRNVLEPFDIDAQPFDSVGMMNLLHCLPGDLKTKGVVFENARAVMKPGATIFGSTMLYKGVEHGAMAKRLLEWNNRKGIMTNLNDDIDDLKDSLQRHFSERSVKMISCVAFFRARN